jgi:hypothetical protein
MQTLNQLEAGPILLEEEEKRHTQRLLVGMLCALLLTGAIFGGYIYLRKRHERQLAAAVALENAKKTTPKVEVFVDEPTVNGKKTLLSGLIHNISGDSLHNVAVELQLRHRTGSSVETRVVTPEVTELAPDGKTRYSLELLIADYLSATFSHVLSGDNHSEIAFKAFPGAARPPMETPAAKTITVSRPAPKGEEFINTKDNPGKVP